MSDNEIFTMHGGNPMISIQLVALYITGFPRTQQCSGVHRLSPRHSSTTSGTVDAHHRLCPSKPQFTHCLWRQWEIPRLSCFHFACRYCEGILLGFFCSTMFSPDIFHSLSWYNKQTRPCLLAAFYLNTLNKIR